HRLAANASASPREPLRQQPQARAAHVSCPDDELMETGMEAAQIKEMVRARYGGIAEGTGDTSCCAPASSSCGDTAPGTPAEKSAGAAGSGQASIALADFL